MPEYLSPGVYIEEIEMGAKPIEGVGTSTAGFLGEAERGPTTPQFITSWLAYQRVYGSYFGADKYLPYAVQGFFANGGQRCFIGRIVKSGDSAATTAMLKLSGEAADALTLDAVGEGEWGNRVAVKVVPGTTQGFRLNVYYWKTAPSSLFDPEVDLTTKPRPQAEIFDDLTVDESSPDYYEKRINGISNLITLTQKAGDSGLAPEAGHSGTATAGTGTSITLANIASATDDTYNGMKITITKGTGSGQSRMITDYNGNTRRATVDANWATNPDNTSVYIIETLIQSLTGGSDSLMHRGTAQAGAAATITLANDASDEDDYYNDATIEIMGGTASGQIRTINDYVGANKVATVSENWDTNPDNTSEYRIIVPDPDLVLADYQRTDSDQPGNRKGLTAFKQIDEIAIVYAPNSQVVTGLTAAIITHCETLKDRFAVVDSNSNTSNIASLNPRNNYDTKYAAFYYPWIKVIDPESGLKRLVPPGGHVIGIYARSDTERGVHKAPANEVVRNTVELEFNLTKGDQDILNPRGVNVIRAFAGRGRRVWGARTLSSDPLWKYVNVRRLFIFLEESIEEGTQWVVFEPNDEKLWARVRQTISQFLTGVWRSGALMGTTAEEAFFVKCDRSTMTQDDIDNGRLIVLIGVAPVKPAEFVIFRIAQWAGGSAVSE